MNIKDHLKEKIKETLLNLDIDISLDDIVIEKPKDNNNGDYSSNIALVLSKKVNLSGLELATQIKDNIKDKLINKINIAGPGFINFFIDKEYLLLNLNEIITKNSEYGRSNIGNNTRINIEFVSVNPTGIMHVGHARGATYGSNLASIMEFSGYNVDKEYFINDAGNQITNVALSISERYKEICGLVYKIPEDGYYGNEIIEMAKSIYKDYGTNKLDSNIEFFKEYGLDVFLNQIKKDLDIYRVNFDIWTSEQSLYDRGLVDDTINKLKDSNKCYIEDKALWLKTTEYGDDKDRVIIKSDGTYTYLLPDIAYHTDKIKRDYSKLIDVLGADHHGYTARLKASLEILGYDSNLLDIKILQMVRIIKDGEELKLSKRTGKTLTLNDLIDEIGVNATRYLFSSKSIDTQMDFNIDIALKQSNENPIYYIEYANARICSILRKNKNELNIKEKYTYLIEEETYTILNKLYEFKAVIEISCLKKLPHLITNYIYELATLFHNYYGKIQIVTDNEEETKERLLLITAIKIVLNNSLNLIGIIPREEM